MNDPKARAAYHPGEPPRPDRAGVAVALAAIAHELRTRNLIELAQDPGETPARRREAANAAAARLGLTH